LLLVGNVASATPSEAPVIIEGWKLSGSSRTAVAAGEALFRLYSGTTERLRIYGDGDTTWYGGTLATGSETAPDVDAGGLCLNHGAGTGNVLTFKNSTVNQPVTDYAEADTYAEFEQCVDGTGGLQINGFTDGATSGPGIRLTAITGDTAIGAAPLIFEVLKSDGGTGVGVPTATESIVDIRTSASKIEIFGDGSTIWKGGTLSTGNEATPDVDDGGLCLDHNAGNGNVLTFKNSEVAHAMTSIAETDTYAEFGKNSATIGGLAISGFSEGSEAGLLLAGHVASASPSEAPVIIEGWKLSGSGRTAVAAGEALVRLYSGSSERLRVYGDGTTTWYGGTLATGSETSPDVVSGGICLNQGSTNGRTLTGKGSLAHGITTQEETDTWLAIQPGAAAAGGAIISGLITSSANTGMTIRGVTEATTVNTAETTGAVGVMHFIASKGDGTTGVSAIGDDENAFVFKNNWTAGTTTRVVIKGDGDIYTAGSLYAGFPTEDPSVGGLSLDVTDGTDPYVIITNDGANHGGVGSEFPNYGCMYIDAYTKTAGGVLLRAVAGDSSNTGFHMNVSAETPSTTTSAAAGGVIQLTASDLDTTAHTEGAVGDTANLFVIRNNSNTALILKGDGDLYWNGSSNAAQAWYDEEDDIALVAAARNDLAHEYDKIDEEDVARLTELGIMQNGFVSTRKMTALQLGAIGQLFNMIRHMAKELGFNEDALLEMAKNYA
jgi:hypothetical protein